MTEHYVEELIRKFADGTATANEIEKLNKWYRSNLGADVQWPSKDQKHEVGARMLSRLKADIATPRSSDARFSWLKIAAILFLCIGVTTVLIFTLRPVDQLISIVNPPGKIRALTLPDGSKVWMNGATSLSYVASFNTKRHVELSGEAYFEVTHDREHPFTVTSGGITTTVKGTTFNINSYKQGAYTTIALLSGKVALSTDKTQLAELTPATQYQFNRRQQTGKLSNIELPRVTAWKRGLLQFDGESFSEIAVVMESWYGTKFKFTNPQLLDCRFYMTVENTTPLNEVLSMLSRITEINYSFNTDSTVVTVSGKGCN